LWCGEVAENCDGNDPVARNDCLVKGGEEGEADVASCYGRARTVYRLWGRSIVWKQTQLCLMSADMRYNMASNKTARIWF
jgi:hypothetical protein